MQYTIKVKPGSSQSKIVPHLDGSYTVYLHATTHDGAANAALLKILSKHFQVPKTSIKITHGQKSRTKIIEF